MFLCKGTGYILSKLDIVLCRVVTHSEVRPGPVAIIHRLWINSFPEIWSVHLTGISQRIQAGSCQQLNTSYWAPFSWHCLESIIEFYMCVEDIWYVCISLNICLSFTRFIISKYFVPNYLTSVLLFLCFTIFISDAISNCFEIV